MERIYHLNFDFIGLVLNCFKGITKNYPFFIYKKQVLQYKVIAFYNKKNPFVLYRYDSNKSKR